MVEREGMERYREQVSLSTHFFFLKQMLKIIQITANRMTAIDRQ